MSGSPLNPYAAPQSPAPATLPPGGQQFAPCPACGNPGGKRVGFTWWGGALGPWMLNHVKCLRCGQAYHGQTGQSNDTAIAIYFGVTAVIGLVVGVALGLLGAAS
ncbi:MAG: hypothetical protein SFU86_16825 [Pirellulaceae bacterium]|nr:hypothetical protein [Pirellulaceae bacterium]